MKTKNFFNKQNRFFLPACKSVILLFIFLFVIACGNKEQKSNFSTEGLVNLDLSKFGKPFSIFVPDTISSKLSVQEQSNGALIIKVGNKFAISINEFKADIELKKQDIKDDEVNKFKAYILEQPNAIIWKSQITHPECHFLMNVTVNNADYSIEDLHNDDNTTYSEEQIQRMYDSCKNLVEAQVKG